MTYKPPAGLYPVASDFIIKPKGKNGIPVKFKATGEFRPPKRGEYYLSGAIIEAYRVANDLSTPYWIAKEVQMQICPTCKGSGHTEVK